MRRDIEAAERETERLARPAERPARARPRAGRPAGGRRRCRSPARSPRPRSAGAGRPRATAAGCSWRTARTRWSGSRPTISPSILDNLIENAIEYGGPGSDVTIGWVVAGRSRSWRSATTGPGVPVGEEERVFERFHRRAARDVPGTGLGLADRARARRALGRRGNDLQPLGGRCVRRGAAALCDRPALYPALTGSWTMLYRPVASVAS